MWVVRGYTYRTKVQASVATTHRTITALAIAHRTTFLARTRQRKLFQPLEQSVFGPIGFPPRGDLQQLSLESIGVDFTLCR